MQQIASYDFGWFKWKIRTTYLHISMLEKMVRFAFSVDSLSIRRGVVLFLYFILTKIVAQIKTDSSV